MVPSDPGNGQVPDERPGSALEGQPRLGWKLALFAVVIMPVLVIVALWFMMDRDRGKPRPDMSGALGPGQRAPVGGELPPAGK